MAFKEGHFFIISVGLDYKKRTRHFNKRNVVEKKKEQKRKPRKKEMIPPGFEPGTLSVLDSRDNHYTTESDRMSASRVTILAYSGDIHLYTEV